MSLNPKKKALENSQIKHMNVGYPSVKRFAFVYFSFRDKEDSSLLFHYCLWSWTGFKASI